MGQALSLHPTHPDQNNPSTAKHYTHIDPAKVTADIFYALLYRHYEPLWDQQAPARASDLYNGPLECFEGYAAEANPPMDALPLPNRLQIGN